MLAFGLLVFAAVMVACNIPAFEPSVEELDLPDAPDQPNFGQPEVEAELPELDLPPEEESIEMELIEIDPEVTLFCTTNFVYLRPNPVKPDDPEEANRAPLLNPGSQISATGNQEHGLADGVEYTWYEVETVSGARGWVAEDSAWLAEGECDPTLVVPKSMRIIESPSTLRGNLWNPRTAHFGIDVHSQMGDLNLYSPLNGTVAASDGCEACLEVNPETGQIEGDRSDEYNFGYGAMVITEYPYEEMSQEQIDDLAGDGITVEPGQSLYLMTAHLNPNRDIAVPGSDVTAGESIATLGTSGDSTGVHGHIEAAVADSGLRPTEGQPINDYWIGTVVDDDYREQGNRVDPTDLVLEP
ncbi:MAG: M23 family metallopeptidase [Anaerolineales bacterium]